MNKLFSTYRDWKTKLSSDAQTHFSPAHFELAKQKLKYLLGGIFGYYALLYSQRAKQLVGDNVIVKNSLVISEDDIDCDFSCRYSELPVASDCIDLVVLPETLQQYQFPHQILREVERVLIPEGHIVLIMENPLSWLSIKKRILSLITEGKQTNGTYGRSRIADWFRLLGLEMVHEIPISPTDQYIKHSQYPNWLKTISNIVGKHIAGYYMIVAKKKVSTMIPIRPSWRRNRKLVSPRFAEPSVNSQVDDYLKHLK